MTVAGHFVIGNEWRKIRVPVLGRVRLDVLLADWSDWTDVGYSPQVIGVVARALVAVDFDVVHQGGNCSVGHGVDQLFGDVVVDFKSLVCSWGDHFVLVLLIHVVYYESLVVSPSLISIGDSDIGLLEAHYHIFDGLLAVVIVNLDG